MATISSSLAGFTTNSASEFLSSSSNSLRGIPLRALGRGRFNTRARAFSVRALKKARMDDYPWPKDPDPNVKGGVLFHLSSFKPLKEKQKPVTLDFEKPLLDLEKKIVDVRKMANDTGLDFTDQIISLENKYQQALKDLYTHLTPIQRVSIARHPNRPTFLDHIFSITEKFVELHGDRAGYDDPAIVTGIGTMDGQRYMFIGQQKGRNTKENIERNFGMPTPHGYRKALRMMEYADHHGFPIVTFIDTPGAYADIRSEELGQGEAIAHNLRSMFGLKVPIVAIVIGEGGSGGALAIGCANKLFMLENAVFYVASPEACAAILWKTAKASPKAAEQLRITAAELCKFEIADGIIPEPLGGAHADPSWTSQQIKIAINEAMDELKKMNTEDVLEHRRLKFRKLGGVQEGMPVDAKFKVNMKTKEEPILGKIPDAELVGEVEKLRQQILKAKESSSKLPELELGEMIEKLRREVDHEFSEAVDALGFKDRLATLREEFSKVTNSQDQLMHPALIDKIEKFKDEFNQGLSAAPNYASLKSKLDMLHELSKAKSLSGNSNLKQEISKRFKEVIDRPDIKEKLESIKVEAQNSGISRFRDFPDSLRQKIVNVKQEIESEVADALKPLSLNVKIVESKVKDLSDQISNLDLKDKIEELNEEINEKIGNVIHSSEIKYMLELLRLEVAKAKNSPDPTSTSKIEALGKQIKQRLSEAVNSSELKEKHEKLQLEISKAMESSGKSDATPGNGSLKDDANFDKRGAEADLDANRGFA